ncbi:MAG: hypothetical protein LBT53_06325 [Puniceicoccales bacterium]|jgi:hypothetical protein|nr:hypothetical protein [Puniceicoccales bacterium]
MPTANSNAVDAHLSQSPPSSDSSAPPAVATNQPDAAVCDFLEHLVFTELTTTTTKTNTTAA